MSLIDEIDSAIGHCSKFGAHEDPHAFWTEMAEILTGWRATLESGVFDEAKRRGDAAAVVRDILDYGTLLDSEFGQTLVRISNKHASNEVN